MNTIVVLMVMFLPMSAAQPARLEMHDFSDMLTCQVAAKNVQKTFGKDVIVYCNLK